MFLEIFMKFRRKDLTFGNDCAIFEVLKQTKQKRSENIMNKNTRIYIDGELHNWKIFDDINYNWSAFDPGELLYDLDGAEVAQFVAYAPADEHTSYDIVQLVSIG